MNHSSGYQEGWLNNLDSGILGSSRLNTLQCTRNEDGIEETPSGSKKKKAKGEVFEVNGGRIVRSLGRKDRHSKVCTARGTRDRRVRLSPNTAIQFYDVQDRLGYDRPSKAIDWLMKEAKAAIDAIVDDSRTTPGFNQTGQMGFSNMANGSVFQNDCPRTSYNNGISASLQTWQNGILFSGGAASSIANHPMADLGQHQIEFTQEREPLQSSLFCPVSSSSSSMPFYSNLNANYLNNGYSYELLSRLEDQSPILRNPSSYHSQLQE